MSAPTVAVVITFYRDDAHFPEALASVLNQTRPPDEIVVVDDASPPGTAETLAHLDPRVRLIRHDTNRGPGAARQTGSDATTSELICYLDADDAWLATKLERQLDDFLATPGLAAHHVGLISFRADGTERIFASKPQRLDLATELRRNQALPSAYLIRRDVLDGVGGWSTRRGIMEDWDLNIRLTAAHHPVGFLAEPLVRFRRTGHGNISSRGLRHVLDNLRTIWPHRRLYRRELGVRGSLAVVGRVVHDEGCRRGGARGLLLRGAGRTLGFRDRARGTMLLVLAGLLLLVGCRIERMTPPAIDTTRTAIDTNGGTDVTTAHFLGLRTAKYTARDLGAAKAWYQQATGIAPYFDEPFYVGFNIGGFELGIVPEEGAAPARAESGVAYWGVTDAHAAWQRLIALGATPHEPIQDVGEGILIGSLHDPFGNVLGIIQNPHFTLGPP